MAVLCKGGASLRRAVDHRWPGRDKASDGWIADGNHASTSDHSPKHGIVHAIDIDADLDRKDPSAAQRLVDELVAYAKSGQQGSGRVKYVIFRGRIYSGTFRKLWWAARKYTGSNPHFSHIHVSFTCEADSDGSPWPLPILKAPKGDSVQKSPAKGSPRGSAKKAAPAARKVSSRKPAK